MVPQQEQEVGRGEDEVEVLHVEEDGEEEAAEEVGAALDGGDREQEEAQEEPVVLEMDMVRDNQTSIKDDEDKHGASCSAAGGAGVSGREDGGEEDELGCDHSQPLE